MDYMDDLIINGAIRTALNDLIGGHVDVDLTDGTRVSGQLMAVAATPGSPIDTHLVVDTTIVDTTIVDTVTGRGLACPRPVEAAADRLVLWADSRLRGPEATVAYGLALADVLASTSGGWGDRSTGDTPEQAVEIAVAESRRILAACAARRDAAPQVVDLRNLVQQ